MKESKLLLKPSGFGQETFAQWKRASLAAEMFYLTLLHRAQFLDKFASLSSTTLCC